MDRGQGMLKVVKDVYEGGKDGIPNWRLMEHAEAALKTGGVEGLRSYYERCVNSNDHKARWVRERLEREGCKTLESEYQRFMDVYRSKSN